ncbi:hypothetical protein L6452_04017 [Arctium lappa]|uniref:Uncharacterized protein n=1 Tax=Arctium lappa TaxID=4217 RepID=A0ACB9FN87_ARCLA|nr:hypothetical protein L6452_04017 [Arctium lappa]
MLRGGRIWGFRSESGGRIGVNTCGTVLVIHTKKRNRLDSQRLNDLVFVQFNAKLINKWAKVKNQNMDVLRSLDASKAQSWIVAISDEEEEKMEEGGNSEARDHEARELHEDDFESDEEPQVEGDEEFEFNSDDERLFDIIDDDNME